MRQNWGDEIWEFGFGGKLGENGEKLGEIGIKNGEFTVEGGYICLV